MDKYDVKKVVGEGSYGKAVLCKRKVDSRLCIIKQISIKKMSRKEALLTEQEATLLKRLQHPNIVSFWESFVTSNSLYIVMEYADGGDLDHYIKAHAKAVPRREIPEKQVLHMFVQLALAIKHIHDRKILHRDLKSQNVFLTTSGQLKLGDFGVSRVLRHTVELAATQIGTPYYMSPEIMDNQRYNSKTDIWSLGCILYELMCLRLPFDGASMKQLCHNIIKATPASPPLSYSSELRELARDVLLKNPKVRPGINAILARPVMRSKISALLGETTKQAEFSHTVLHGANVLNAPLVPVPSTALGQQPANAGARPSSAPPVVAAPSAAPPVASSAAQAVAMLQLQRQQQLLRLQQQQALQQQAQQQKALQQQQYVGAMAAQMKEQVELARQAEAVRVRAQQLQAEEQQRRVRVQAQERARVEQVRLMEQQKAAEKARIAQAQQAYQDKKQQEELDRLRRAALAEQQQKLERRRQERLDFEAQKLKADKEREREREREKERAQKVRAPLYQPPPARVASPVVVPSPRVAPAVPANGKVAVPSSIAQALGRKAPIPSAAAPAPVVRQFSAAALLAKRRHSAPEQPPASLAANRPPWVSVLDPPPVAEKPAANPFSDVVSSSPEPRGPAAPPNPAQRVQSVKTSSSGDGSSSSSSSSSAKEQAAATAAEVPVRQPASARSPATYAESPVVQERRAQAVDGVLLKAQDVMDVVQQLQNNARKPPIRARPALSPAVGPADDDDSSSTSYGSVVPVTPTISVPSGAVADSAQQDKARQQRPMRIDTAPASSAADGSQLNTPAAGSPWLSDLMGQMGQLRNQMQNLQQMRSPVVDTDSSSVVSSLTAQSPSGVSVQSSVQTSSANTPRVPAAQSPCQPAERDRHAELQHRHHQHHQHHHHQHLQQEQQRSERTRKDSQRMSFPMTETSSGARLQSGDGSRHALESHSVTEDDGASVGSALIHRKESRDRHKADFRAFVQARRVNKASEASEDGGGGGSEHQAKEEEAAAKILDDREGTEGLRIKVPTTEAPRHQQKRGAEAPGSQHPTPLAPGKAGATPTGRSEHKHPAQHSQGKGRAQASKESPVPGGAQTPHSVRTGIVSSSSSASLQSSPRGSDAAGFNVAEFRSQKEAQRQEMRQLMQERRAHIRKAQEQLEEAVLVHGEPPAWKEESPRAADQGSTFAYDKGGLREAHPGIGLQHAADLAYGEEHQLPGSGAGQATMLEYSVLIEQMQAILRKPSLDKTGPVLRSRPPIHRGAQGESSLRTPEPLGFAGAGHEPAMPGRALVADMILEDADVETEGDEDASAGPGAMPYQCAHGDAGDEDEDEFGEEDDPISAEAAALLEGEVESDGEEEDRNQKRWEGEGDGESSEFDGDDMDGEEGDAPCEQLHFARNPDPFMQPLVPALLTADAMLLMDPLRHALGGGDQPRAPAGADAPSTPPPSKGLHAGTHGGEGAAEEKARRLKIAELQEYLVGKLGSRKVSEALHLLTVNTAATLTPGEERTDGFYDDRDEELLNRLEEILGVDSLHYLDDMFLLLTLQ